MKDTAFRAEGRDINDYLPRWHREGNDYILDETMILAAATVEK